MAEPTDAIMPILQRIQTDVGELKRDVGDLKRDVAALRKSFEAQNEKLREMNGYLSFNLGITSPHTFDIDELRKEGEAVKQRLRSLETHA
jgi:hypothetical protein